MSMLSDAFPAKRRATAISVLSIGGAAGTTLGAMISATLNEHFGWHIALLVVAAPGFVLALAMWLTVKEPPRTQVRAAHLAPPSRGIGPSLRHIFMTPTFGPLLAAMVFNNVAIFAWQYWTPTFLIRVHHLSTAEMGTVFGVSTGLGALIGTGSVGFVSDWLARRGARWRMYYAAVLAGLAAPCFVGVLWADDIRLVSVFIVAFSMTAGGLTAISNAAMVSIARPDMRAFTTAVTAFVVTIVAAGCTPWVIGSLNDHLAQTYGAVAVRYSLIVAPMALGTACLLFLWSSRRIETDEEAALTGAPRSGA